MNRSRIFLALLLACNVFFGIKAFAQATPTWDRARIYDYGQQSSVAIVPSSNYVVEFHKSQNNDTMWYSTGKITGTGGNTYVYFSDSHSTDTNGYWPTVTVTKEGYVILVYSPSNQVVPQIIYSVGKINPSGDRDQTIQWLVKNQAFGYGFHASLSVNNSGQFAIAYECRNGCQPDLVYRLGHLDNPSAGRYNIIWDTGSNYVQYDRGVNPHISINDQGQVIEAHQVNAKENLLHYRRGTYTSSKIEFQASKRYDNYGKQPAVTLSNNGKVFELHISSDSVFARTGILNTSDPERVDWSNSVNLGTMRYNNYPAATNNNVLAVGTWAAGDSTWSDPGNLQYSLTPVQ
jgi:hypothetical protein